MEDEWSLSVDIFEVDVTFNVSVERGPQVTHAECDCDATKTIADGGDPTTKCRHTRQARARIETIFDDREWKSLSVAKDVVFINEAPAQWAPLINDDKEDK
jgi:hypothetical protein